MNNGNNIFTRTLANIDTRAWLTLIIVAFLSTVVLAFKWVNQVKCLPYDITAKGYTAGKDNTFYLGSSIQFKTTLKGKEKITWDFGDKGKATGDSTTHAFAREGVYTITATVSGQCEAFYKVTIIRMEQAKATSTVSMDNPIGGPEVLYTNEPTSFTCALAGDSYEWNVLNSPEFPTQTTATANFVFPIPGARILELKLDGDPSKVYRKTIQVLAKASMDAPAALPTDALPQVLPPPTAAPDAKENTEPEAPKVMIIPNEEFKNLLNAVTSGDKDLQSITQYLCNPDKTKVLLNGTEWETVTSFVQKIYGKKRYDIKSVEAVRDANNNCVTILKIKYKKRLF